jgi:hypothetical protein
VLRRWLRHPFINILWHGGEDIGHLKPLRPQLLQPQSFISALNILILIPTPITRISTRIILATYTIDCSTSSKALDTSTLWVCLRHKDISIWRRHIFIYLLRRFIRDKRWTWYRRGTHYLAVPLSCVIHSILVYSCEELLSACHNSTTALRTWLGGVLDERFSFFVPAERKKEKWQRKAEILKLIRDQLRSEIETFRAEKRYVAYAICSRARCVC